MRIIKTVVIILIMLTSYQCQTSNPSDITIDRNGVLLKGKFYISNGKGTNPTTILLPGFPGGESDVLGIGRILSEAGINALIFNYSGTHQSQGELNFGNTQKDIQAAFDFIHKPENVHKYKIDTTRIILGGYSYGGGMAMTYAANHPEINSVFSIGGNDHGAFMKEYNRNPEMRKDIDNMFDELKMEKEIVRFGPGGTVKEIAEMRIVELNPTYDLLNCVPFLIKKNILLIAGWDDNSVSIENIVLPLYRELKYEKAKNVTITAVQDDHSFKNSREYLALTIIEWINTIME
ncbi:alpha/beta hydrolase [Candidatus Neomarinimicrobiota bacterium]